ncbi:hypothetical protein J7E38_18155 [Bacillus sp. ISL-35]|uniref:hypothetical protein n=1 Tax=Bacillus sp. ISL-35 TaxID=2819122 RepID=UPI001BE826B3|nr:hypothetical protein [Bacillus sp. ISL-35]MBT2680918.1 hypothetical protein [Bacillus sp. ISL-35]MBT2705234.1 hypothetical protein [Chryseobacterium sp. ISL-80]
MKRNKNYLPFLILLIVHTWMLAFTFYRKKDRKKLFITLLSGMGLCFIFEYVVLSLFRAYRYKPRIFLNKDLDNFLGAIHSQAVFVPFTALFLTAFKIGWKGKVFFSLYFAGIERLFLKWSIHQNHWWKTTYTMTLIPLFFYINDFWYGQLRKGSPIFKFGSLFLGILVSGLNLMYSMSIFRKFKFGRGRRHSWKEHFRVAPLYSFALSFVTAVIIKKNSGMKGILYSFAFSKFMDFSVMKTGIAMKNFRHVLINNSIHFLMIY